MTDAPSTTPESTATPTPTPTPTPTVRRFNPFESFEDECLQLVIVPKLFPLIRSRSHESKSALLAEFNSTFGSHVSMTHFNRWLEKLNIQAKKVVMEFSFSKDGTGNLDERDEEDHRDEPPVGLYPPVTRAPALTPFRR